MVFDISFKTLKDRKKFDKEYKNLIKVLVDNNSNDFGFGAYKMFRDTTIDVVYYMGFMGYAEPIDILKECKQKNIKINKFLSLDLSANSSWYDEVKEKSMEDLK